MTKVVPKYTDISQVKSIGEIAEFWDTHSVADYWDQTYEVNFEVRARRRQRVTLDPEAFEKIGTRARERGILSETLVNLWLAERLHEPG